MELKTIIERKNGQSIRYGRSISTARVTLLRELHDLAQLEKIEGEPKVLEYGLTIKIK